MKAYVTTIMPEEAKGLLDINTNNRPLRSRRVTLMANAMQRGEWELNGDSIRLSETNVVLDGQHRLSAVIESGVPMETLLVTGLADSVFDTIDRGASRKVSDILGINGEKSPNELAATARQLYILRDTGDVIAPSAGRDPTARQIQEFIESEPGIRDSVRNALKLRWPRRFLGPTALCFCYHLLSSKHPESAADFFAMLESGIVPRESSVVMLLRDRLVMEKEGEAGRSSGSRIKILLTFKAFSFYISGRNPQRLITPNVDKSKNKTIFDI